MAFLAGREPSSPPYWGLPRNGKRRELCEHDVSDFLRWDEQVGRTQFEELCQRFDHDDPAFMAELRKKRDPYLAFLKYPHAIRRSLSTPHAVEAVNG